MQFQSDVVCSAQSITWQLRHLRIRTTCFQSRRWSYFIGLTVFICRPLRCPTEAMNYNYYDPTKPEESFDRTPGSQRYLRDGVLPRRTCIQGSSLTSGAVCCWVLSFDLSLVVVSLSYYIYIYIPFFFALLLKFCLGSGSPGSWSEECSGLG